MTERMSNERFLLFKRDYERCQQDNADGLYDEDKVELFEGLAAEREEVQRLRDPGWHPIETAPKDGTVILIYPHKKVRAGNPQFVTEARWHQPGNPKFNGWWQTARGSTKIATHWMPLPEPPKEDGDERL